MAGKKARKIAESMAFNLWSGGRKAAQIAAATGLKEVEVARLIAMWEGGRD